MLLSQMELVLTLIRKALAGCNPPTLGDWPCSAAGLGGGSRGLHCRKGRAQTLQDCTTALRPPSHTYVQNCTVPHPLHGRGGVTSDGGRASASGGGGLHLGEGGRQLLMGGEHLHQGGLISHLPHKSVHTAQPSLHSLVHCNASLTLHCPPPLTDTHCHAAHALHYCPSEVEFHAARCSHSFRQSIA